MRSLLSKTASLLLSIFC